MNTSNVPANAFDKETIIAPCNGPSIYPAISSIGEIKPNIKTQIKANMKYENKIIK